MPKSPLPSDVERQRRVTGFSEGASVEPCQPGSAGGPRSLAAALRLQLGLAFIGSDRLARFGGLLHFRLRLDDIEPFLAGILVADHPHACRRAHLIETTARAIPPASATPEPRFKPAWQG